MKTWYLFFMVSIACNFGFLNAQSGAALDFDGVNDYVNIPSTTNLESYGTTNEITVEFWVKPNAGINNAYDPLVSKRYNSNVAGILINKKTAAGLHNHYLRLGGTWVTLDVTYPNNVWSHVALTYKAGVGMRVYINGVLVGSNAASGVLQVNNAPLQLGGETAQTGNKYTGQMDEFKLWSRALSATEIQSQLSCQLTGSQNGLLAYYQFNEGIAGGSNAGTTSLPDLSGNGHNGTLQNFALSGLTSNWVAPGGTACTFGAVASALDFDGNSNVVNVPSTSTLESYGTSNEITVEYWVNPDPTLNYIPTPTQTQAFEPLVSKRLTSNNAGILIDKLTAGGIHTHWLRFTTGWERVDVPYPTSTWSHVALTYQAGSGMNVYVNGALVGSNPINGSLVVNNAPLQLGGETAVYGYKYWGSMDEFRLWDRALTHAEINSNMSCELSGSEAGLLAYYQFNQGIAAGPNAGVTNLPDLSGNNHNGTLQNFALNGSNSNWIAPGGVVTGVSCSANAIPTLSQWGLIIFSLLMLNFGAIAILRRRKEFKVNLPE